jgi:putative peptidoglycan lipid II flippase
MNIVFVPIFAHAGLALATSLAACANAGLLYWGLRKKKIYTPSPGWPGLILKILASAIVMGVAIGVIAIELDWSGLSHAPLLRAIWLGIILLIAAIVYFSMLRIFGIRWIQFLKKDKA